MAVSESVSRSKNVGMLSCIRMFARENDPASLAYLCHEIRETVAVSSLKKNTCPSDRQE